MTEHERRITRRRLLALPPLGLLAGQADVFVSPAPAATPAVYDADDDPTPELTEGPYFTPNSPRRRSIVHAGARGTRLTLGVVGNRSDGIFDTDCLVRNWRLSDGRRLAGFDFVLDV